MPLKIARTQAPPYLCIISCKDESVAGREPFFGDLADVADELL